MKPSPKDLYTLIKMLVFVLLFAWGVKTTAESNRIEDPNGGRVDCKAASQEQLERYFTASPEEQAKMKFDDCKTYR